MYDIEIREAEKLLNSIKQETDAVQQRRKQNEYDRDNLQRLKNDTERLQKADRDAIDALQRQIGENEAVRRTKSFPRKIFFETTKENFFFSEHRNSTTQNRRYRRRTRSLQTGKSTFVERNQPFAKRNLCRKFSKIQRRNRKG